MSKPQDRDIVSLAQKLQHHLLVNSLIKDRKSNLKHYRQCFVGNEVVPIIIKLKLVPISKTSTSETVSNAIKFGNALIEAGIIQHVVKKHAFINDKLFYEFVSGYNNTDTFTKRRKSVDEGDGNNKDFNEQKARLVPAWNDNLEPSMTFSVSNTKMLTEIEEKRHQNKTLRRQKTNADLALSSHNILFSSLKASLSSSACTIIVFGASGHLAKTKTYPALYDLFNEGMFPDDVNIVGYARSKLTKTNFDKKVSIKLKGDSQSPFLKRCSYFSGKGYDDDDSYKLFADYIHKLEDAKYNGRSNRICYLATPPTVFIAVCERIKRYLFVNDGFMRVIIEKPFGKDLESSNKLHTEIGKFLSEEKVYRIDHYLAKEMVQNIIVFRFANVIWDAIWNRKCIRCVKISMKETAALDGRGGYYDEYGVIRDVLQNHLLQVLTLIAMEQPCSLRSEDVRDEKVKVLKCIEPMSDKLTVIGQYAKSVGGKKPGYRDDPSIKNSANPSSNQITYVQTILYVNNHRWAHVPFICKCGKGLDAKNSEVRIQFKNDGLCLFPDANFNEIVMRLQPNEAIWCKVNTKTPGFARFDTAQAFELDITYKNRFGPLKLPKAYTRLIKDALEGDQSLFVRADELRESWRIVTPFLHKLESENKDPQKYPRGSRGPPQADTMSEQFGFRQSSHYQWKPPVFHNVMKKGNL